MRAAAARCAASASRSSGRATLNQRSPLGGRSLAEFAVEGRYRFGNYGVVAFVDAGQVYESQYPTSSDCASASASAAGSTPISARSGSTSPRRSPAARANR